MFHLDELLAACGGEMAGGRSEMGPVRFTGVTVDSRRPLAGGLFVALPGERHDGHDFVAEALAGGCRGALVRSDRMGQLAGLAARVYRLQEGRWEVSGPADAPVLVIVPDTLRGLQQLAGRWRTRFSAATVIGITGSVGKSSTKELTAALLSRHLPTLRNPKSYNNEIGLPLTLLEVRPEHRAVVLEMGTYGPGEITFLTDLARPHVGVVINVSHSHLERMGSLETIAQAKSELPAALPPDGLAVLNGDEPLIRRMAAVTRARVLYYGLEKGCDLRAENVRTQGLEGISFDLWAEGERRHLRCCLLGRRSVYNALAAVAVARHLGVGWEAIQEGLLDRSARLRLLPLVGVGGATLLDDTYNASPVSCRAALDLLAKVPGNKIAVLGDMLELGSFEEEGHRLVGEWAAGVVQELFLLGERARWIGQAAVAHGLPPACVHLAASHEEIVQALRDRLGPEDVVLVKGSRAMEMERVLQALVRKEE